MAALTEPLDRSHASPGLGLAIAILAVLTVIRLVGLRYSAVDLFFDEAQYWVWSRDLAFGYFSKPPLLAWIIAASDQFCGSGEACVRIASPLFYLGTSLIVYAIADELYGMAGIGPEDVDVAEIYDCFTISTVALLEDLKFCKKGEGGPFVASEYVPSHFA